MIDSLGVPVRVPTEGFNVSIESYLEGLERAAPLLLLRLLDVREGDATAALVLIVDELLGMVPLLVAHVTEELGNVLKSDVVAVEVGGEGEVDVRGVHLGIDLGRCGQEKGQPAS